MEPISKRQTKLDKIQKKRLTSKPQNSQITQKMATDNVITSRDSNIQIQYIDPVSQMKKAKQWWLEIDTTYFKPAKLKSILLSRDLTSPERLGDFNYGETLIKGSYENEQIFSVYPHLAQNNLLNVLLKSSTPFLTNLVTFSFVNYVSNLSKRATKTVKQQIEFEETLNYKVSSLNKKSQSSNKLQLSEEEIIELLKNSNFQYNSIVIEDFLLSKIERAQKIRSKMMGDSQINIQIEIWKQEALIYNSQNSIFWNNLISNHSKCIQVEEKNLSSQISTIKQSLMHYTILRYMQHGTRDKTQLMLNQLLDNMKMIKPAKTRDSMNKKFFETDCKICFCSFNYDSNQVLYCDMCNTSFHLACYGLQEVPQEKQYFCDRCTAIKKDDKSQNSSKKITCQICCKPNFPIKNIDGHFYHMTCLILFNFVTIKNHKIQLQEGLNHSNIIKRVIQCQLECQSCMFCFGSSGAEMGMQFRCSFEGCNSSMHPICAYINGCRFDIKKSMGQKKLEVNILCNKHDCERDYIQQTYLRRYMCNFKNTSQKSLQSFRAQYQAEILSRQSKIDTKLQKIPNIIIDTKVIRKYISQKQQKRPEKNQDIPNTQTRKIFEKLLKTNF